MPLASVRDSGTAGGSSPAARETQRRGLKVSEIFADSSGNGYREYPWRAEAGSFVKEPAGVTHTLVVPDDNEELTDVIYVVEGGNINFDADGNFLYYEDGRSMLEFYVSTCREQGIELPGDLSG